MTLNETIDLLKLIDRCYDTKHTQDKDIIDDWYKVLKNYDLKDMAKSLDDYMKNYTTYAPKVYELTRGYNTIEKKKLIDTAKTRCLFCGKVIGLDESKHEDKCRSIEFIKRAVKRFKNQDIDIERYRNMSEDEFEKYYNEAVKLVVKNSTNTLEVEMWKKYLNNKHSVI